MYSQTRKVSYIMKKLGSLFARTTVGLAAAFLASQASANVGFITFDNINPDVFFGGDSFADGSAFMTALGGGFAGAVTDSAGCSGSAIVCPVGNATQFYTGLNDGALMVTLGEESLHMTSLDFGFVLPVPVSLSGSVGQLILAGVDADGNYTFLSKEFGLQDNNGDYGFEHWALDSAFTNMAFKSVTLVACVYDVNGDCQNPSNNQAQFAVDNIGFLPEPASLALTGVSLFGLLAAGRRRQAR